MSSRPEYRGWQALFDRLNEAKAYRYLTKIGCSSVVFIPRTIKQTPDSEGWLEGQQILCEVKTINISDEEVNARRSFAVRSVAGRLEWYDDPDGFTTGTAQSVKEATLTGEYKMSSWLLSRLEFRDDWSNQSFFQKNGGTGKSQPTVLLGMVAFFGPKK